MNLSAGDEIEGRSNSFTSVGYHESPVASIVMLFHVSLPPRLTPRDVTPPSRLVLFASLHVHPPHGESNSAGPTELCCLTRSSGDLFAPAPSPRTARNLRRILMPSSRRILPAIVPWAEHPDRFFRRLFSQLSCGRWSWGVTGNCVAMLFPPASRDAAALLRRASIGDDCNTSMFVDLPWEQLTSYSSQAEDFSLRSIHRMQNLVVCRIDPRATIPPLVRKR
ncbi:hypothetical protein FB451DRAFT_1274333 [Mycena latifolia]|nr:hypothetical protein FB451DRAFT_1274333 [Mycena latifolia]